MIVTVDPLSTFVPDDGDMEMTLPLLASLEEANTVFTLSPRSCNVLVAELCVEPTTFGSVTCSGPDETTSRTREPLSAGVLPGGSVRMTRP